MAEDEDGVSDKKSPQNSNNSGHSEENQQNSTKPDLGIEETKYHSKENGQKSPTEPTSSTSKSGGIRKEDSPFSLRHFLKRDLSLPGNSTYENTGARPKVYANTVQHSPTRFDKIDIHGDSRRDKNRPNESNAKEKRNDCGIHRISDDASSSSSVEIPFSVVEESDSKHNLYTDSSEGPFFHRPNIASDTLGIPSLPDFVQDHILVEQAYLNSNGPISVDLDNLPDFTYTNSNYNVGSSSSLGRRNKNSFGNNRSYDYQAYLDTASTSNELPSASGNALVNLSANTQTVPQPLDLVHLNLDLTESVNPVDRRHVSPRNNFPLDLPPSAGADSMRLPDFLPVHPGRTSPEPQNQNEDMQHLVLERTRSELFMERNRRLRAEEELSSVCEALRVARAEVRTARDSSAAGGAAGVAASGAAGVAASGAAGVAASGAAGGAGARVCGAAGLCRDRDYYALAEAGSSSGRADTEDAVEIVESTSTLSTVEKLKNEIKKLKEELSSSQAEVRSLRQTQSNAAVGLRHASTVAETSLRELLAGLERLKSLSSTLDPT